MLLFVKPDNGFYLTNSIADYEKLPKTPSHQFDKKRIHGLRLTHNKSYRKWSRCVKISVTEGFILKAHPEGGQGDTTQYTGVRQSSKATLCEGI